MSTNLAPGALLSSGDVFSSRERVNVIMSTADNRDGNNYYAPVRGKAVEHIRDCVLSAFLELRPTLVQRYGDAPDVTIIGANGRYSYMVRVATPRP
jgi:hypothetical protein